MPIRNRCPFSRRRRPAALPVVIGLSLAGSVPIVAAQVSPIEASAVTGVVDGGYEEETVLHISDMPGSCFSGWKVRNGETGEIEYLMTGKSDGSFVVYRFDVARSGTYEVSIETRSNNGGKKSNYVLMDGRQELQALDTAGGEYGWQTYSFFLEAGSHELKIMPNWGWTFFRDVKIRCTGLKKTSADTLAECEHTQSSGINSYRHADDGTLLKNPGKGLTTLGYSADGDDIGYTQALSVVYTRWCWSDIEPREGEYDWSIIDSYIARAAARGHKAAFGIMSFNSSGYVENATPRWVFDEAGADGRWIHYYGDESTPAMFCPNWNDPIYQEKVADFAKALAARYDGDPRIAYIDMRAYGNWGEQHLSGIDESHGGYPWISSDTLIEKYMKPYRDAFKKTLIVLPLNHNDYPEVCRWAVANGIALRRDGIMRSSNGSEFRIYGSGESTPNIYEYHSNYADTMDANGWIDDSQFEDELEFEVRNGAASYLQMDRDMYWKMEEKYRYLGNLIGYWWRMPESSVTSAVDSGQSIRASYQIRNDGVAHSYDRAAKVKARICDAEGNVVKTIDDTGAKPWKWEPGKLNDDKAWTNPTVSNESFDIDTVGLAPGRYYASIGVFSGEASGSTSPDSSIGSLGRDVDGWEAVGMFEVRQPGQQIPSGPSDSANGDGGTGSGTPDGGVDDSSSGGKEDGEETDKPGAVGDDAGTVGDAVNGGWNMPKDPEKRAALVKTGYTAGGLAAGIAVAGVALMIVRAVGSRRE